MATASGKGQKTGVFGGWKHGMTEWSENGSEKSIKISVAFSWLKEKAEKRKRKLEKDGYAVALGGPAYRTNPFEHNFEAVLHHNDRAPFTSRGCIRRCEFCIVPELEGDIQELNHWVPRPLVCDNNLLACSRVHFDRVIDSLKPLSGIDFNQGLDARLLNTHHVARIAELDLKCVRLAWDSIRTESRFMRGYELLRAAKIPKRKIRVYVLIGHKDTPEDALYRLRTLASGLKVLPNPMRYQPIDTPKRNAYVGEHWTDEELKRYMRYWAALRFTGAIPFEEFMRGEYTLQKHKGK